MPDNTLHDAAASGDLETIKVLIAKDSDVNAKHSEHNTYPVYFAAQNGHLSIVQYLIETCGANYSCDNYHLIYWSNMCSVLEKKKALREYIRDAICDGSLVFNNTDLLQFATDQNNLGDEYFNKKQYAEAMPLYRSAIEIQKQAISKDYAEAMPLYRSAIEMQKQAISKDESAKNLLWKLATYQNNLGAAYSQLHQFAKALTWLKDALLTQKQLVSKDESAKNLEQLAFYQNNLGNTYDNQQQHSEATRYYEDAIATQKKLISNDESAGNLQQLAIYQNNLGNTYYNQQQYAEAAVCFNDACLTLKQLISKDESVENLRRLAICQNNSGNTYYNQQQHSEATRYYEDAIATQKELLSNDETAAELQKLMDYQYNLSKYRKDFAQIFFQQRDYQKVVSIAQQGVDEILSVPQFMKSADGYQCLANFYADLSDVEHQNTINFSFASFANRIFMQNAPAEVTIEEFYLLHSSILGKENWKSCAKLITPLTQFMKIITEVYQDENLSKSSFITTLKSQPDEIKRFNELLDELTPVNNTLTGLVSESAALPVAIVTMLADQQAKIERLEMQLQDVEQNKKTTQLAFGTNQSPSRQKPISDFFKNEKKPKGGASTNDGALKFAKKS